MSNFPKRSSAFNPDAYRSQAAYNAHQSALRTSTSSDIDLCKKQPTDIQKPTDMQKPNQPSDVPKPNSSFNRHAYRGHSNTNASRGGINPPKQQFHKHKSQKQHYQKTRKECPTEPATGSSTQPAADEPHIMTDAEVKEWFRQAEVEYEEKKKAGHYKDYVPAGGHTPDFSAFRAKFSTSKANVPGGLKGSMHAPSPAELAKLQGRKEW
ncbi:hypothetical protein N0V85_005259 [Neurospora sp. IMI 360204]|nr:hypothetical protein N0V85_005259 [Neurospora sp. IMI 360204]